MGTAEEVRIRQPCMVRWGEGSEPYSPGSFCLHMPGTSPRPSHAGSKLPWQPKLWLEPGWGARRTLKQNSDVPRITERGQGVQIHRKGHWAPRQAQNDHPRLSQTAETGTAKQPGHSLEVTIRKQGALSNST